MPQSSESATFSLCTGVTRMGMSGVSSLGLYFFRDREDVVGLQTVASGVSSLGATLGLWSISSAAGYSNLGLGASRRSRPDRDL